MTLDAVEHPQPLGRGLGIVPRRKEPQAPAAVLVDQRAQGVLFTTHHAGQHTPPGGRLPGGAVGGALGWAVTPSISSAARPSPARAGGFDPYEDAVRNAVEDIGDQPRHWVSCAGGLGTDLRDQPIPETRPALDILSSAINAGLDSGSLVGRTSGIFSYSCRYASAQSTCVHRRLRLPRGFASPRSTKLRTGAIHP